MIYLQKRNPDKSLGFIFVNKYPWETQKNLGKIATSDSIPGRLIIHHGRLNDL